MRSTIAIVRAVVYVPLQLKLEKAKQFKQLTITKQKDFHPSKHVGL